MQGGVGVILGTFGARLGLDTNQYSRGILRADALNQVFGQGVTAFMANPLLGAANALQAVGRGLVNHTARLAESAEETERLGQRTGATAELIQALGGRAEQAGVGFAVIEQGIRTAVRRLGEARQESAEAQKVFDQLGIDPEKIRSTDELIERIVEGLNRYTNEGERAAIAARILGDEAGTKFQNVVGGGRDALAALVAEQKALGQVLDAGTISSLAAFNTQIGKTQQLTSGLINVGLGNFLAGFIDETGLAKVNIDELGRSLVDTIGPAARELGQTFGQIAEDIAEIADAAERIDDFGRNAEGYAKAIEAISANTGAAVIGAAGPFLDATPSGSLAAQGERAFQRLQRRLGQ
jgi:methyl-accepting chemotaxis protein